MITDLAEIRRISEAQSAENTEFRRYLKAHHHSDGPFHILAREVEAKIDCTQCANCCRELEVNVSIEEVQAIAVFLGTSSAEVFRLYTKADSTAVGAKVLKQPDGNCVFLDGNLCMIYDARPLACREFPHSELDRQTLGGRMSSQCRRASVCPIVFNALQEYKHLVGFSPHDSA